MKDEPKTIFTPFLISNAHFEMISYIYYSIPYLKIYYNIILNMEEEFNKLKQEIETLKNKNTELEEKLKTYTNNHRHKKYYDNNTEIVIQRAKQEK
jgi:cell division protein FtsB